MTRSGREGAGEGGGSAVLPPLPCGRIPSPAALRRWSRGQVVPRAWSAPTRYRGAPGGGRSRTAAPTRAGPGPRRWLVLPLAWTCTWLVHRTQTIGTWQGLDRRRIVCDRPYTKVRHTRRPGLLGGRR